MKYLLVAALVLTPTQDADEPIVMSPVERAFIQQFIMRQSDQIEQLEKALRTEKERTACA